MSHPHHDKEDDQIHPVAKALFGWVSFKRTPELIFYGLAIACVSLIAADFFVDRHEKMDTANVNGFYALYGFTAFAFVVLMGHPLAKLLRRDENYYGDNDEDIEDDK